MEKRVSKRHTMKYRFLKDKIWVYLGTFTLPVLILGLISLAGIYVGEQGKVKEKLETSLNLAVDYADSFYAHSDAFQMYLGSGQRVDQFYKVFQSDKVDYDSVNALRYLSAYMISLENSGTDIDSIYFYQDNKSKRVITSEKPLVIADNMSDQEWIETLLSMKKTKHMRK